MWKSQKVSLVLLAAALGGCPDYTTGQDPEPAGPLRITRLTLFDAVSRDVNVFSDTSIPDCSVPANQETPACKSDINRDNYGLKKSPPTPDSGREVRVVFNKLPLRNGDQELERRIDEPGRPPRFELTEPNAATLSCSGCTGQPPQQRSVYLGGSDTTSDPTYPHTHPASIPYGPGILIEVKPDAMRPFAALEPETAYSVAVSPNIADRNGERVLLDSVAAALLRFTTEPFKLLRVGIGDAKGDKWVYDGKAGDPRGPASFRVEGVALDGVVAVTLNAPYDEPALQAMTATATQGGMDVPLKLGASRLVKKDGKDACDPAQRRSLYIFPAAKRWPNAGEATIILKGTQVRDLSQAAGHPTGQGRHTLRGDITITAIVTGAAADDKYKGLTAAKVSAAADCPP